MKTGDGNNGQFIGNYYLLRTPFLFGSLLNNWIIKKSERKL